MTRSQLTTDQVRDLEGFVDDRITAAGVGVTIKDVRWTPYGTVVLGDDFRDASLDGAWGRVDEGSSSGAATWTEAGDSLSLFLDGGDSAAEMHAMMRSHSLAVGDAIQCHVTAANPNVNNQAAGLVVANGNTYGAGLQETTVWFQNLNILSTAEWSNYSTRTAGFTDTTSAFFGNSLHLRLKRSATNTYQHFVSIDGISWVKLGADRTQTMTPSYVGVWGSTYAGASDMAFSFDYFRVVTP